MTGDYSRWLATETEARRADVKRALWCRWFHRYHPAPIPVPPPGTPPAAAIITSRRLRRYCRACADMD